MLIKPGVFAWRRVYGNKEGLQLYCLFLSSLSWQCFLFGS